MRQYVLQADRRGLKARAILKRDDGARGSAVVALPKGLPPEVYADVLTAVQRAYEDGRADRAGELLPASQPPSVTRNLVLRQALEAMRASMPGWLPTGWLPPADRVVQYRIEVGAGDMARGACEAVIGTEHAFPLRSYRLQLLVEET